MTIFTGARKHDDVFIGNDRADRFEFAARDLTSGDTIVGGAGKDTLAFTAAGRVSADALANVSGIERVELADGGMILELTQQLATTGTDGRLTVVGGIDADTIDARRVATQAGGPTAEVTLLGGAGDDTLLGGSDGRLVFDGGEGSDTVSGIRGTVVYDAADRRVTLTAGGTLRVASAVTLDLTRTNDQSLGDVCVVRGFTAVDASASKESVMVTAGQGQSVIGGSGADRITGATEITGGRGADVLVGSATAATRFVLDEGDFARGESILGRSGSDSVLVYGQADLSRGSMEGIGTLVLASTAAGHAGVAIVSATQAMSLNYLQGAGELVIELGREHALDLRYLNDQSFGGIAETIHGSSGADEISAVAQGFARGPLLTIEGGGGDDLIWANADAVSLDGGAGNDTVRIVGHFGDTIEIDLARTDNQGVSGVGVLKGFENVSLANGATVTATIHGSAGTNVITGSFGHSTIYGEGGDDVLAGVSDFSASAVLDGGAGNDVLLGTAGLSSNTMTGGEGADAFRWTGRSFPGDYDLFDVVGDFHQGEDRLEFAKTRFGIAGDAFDARLVDTGDQTSVVGVDLVIYTGGTLNNADDVGAYLSRLDATNDGIFVAGVNSQGDTVLFHSSSAFSGASYVTQVADFAGVQPAQLTLSDFAFI